MWWSIVEVEVVVVEGRCQGQVEFNGTVAKVAAVEPSGVTFSASSILRMPS